MGDFGGFSVFTVTNPVIAAQSGYSVPNQPHRINFTPYSGPNQPHRINSTRYSGLHGIESQKSSQIRLFRNILSNSDAVKSTPSH